MGGQPNVYAYMVNNLFSFTSFVYNGGQKVPKVCPRSYWMPPYQVQSYETTILKKIILINANIFLNPIIISFWNATSGPLGLRMSITSVVGMVLSDRQTLNNEYVSFLDVST